MLQNVRMMMLEKYLNDQLIVILSLEVGNFYKVNYAYRIFVMAKSCFTVFI